MTTIAELETQVADLERTANAASLLVLTGKKQVVEYEESEAKAYAALRSARDELDTARAADPYPVGTFLALDDTTWAFRLPSVHGSLVAELHYGDVKRGTDNPVWRTIHSDGSGSYFSTYATLISGSLSYPESSIEVLYQPTN